MEAGENNFSLIKNTYFYYHFYLICELLFIYQIDFYVYN